MNCPNCHAVMRIRDLDEDAGIASGNTLTASGSDRSLAGSAGTFWTKKAWVCANCGYAKIL